MFGWMGKVLKVDLKTKEIKKEDLNYDLSKNYLGGRGLGAKILFEEVGREVRPFDSANKIILATGPLTGTIAPTSSRFSLTTKSPLTGTILDANSGGRWGVVFKKCGYDLLIISGRAEEPVYIDIKDDQVKIKDANELWGMDVLAVTERLLKIEGERSSILSIGPAGERGALISSIINDKYRALGRGGAGAVMGSKNLKAIVVYGTREIKVADRERLKFIVYECNKWLRSHPITSKALPQFGTAVLVNICNETGIFPSRNYQKSYFEGAERLSGEAIRERLLVKRSGCLGCIIQCARVTKTSNMEGEGPEYESDWALGADCGLDDLEVVAEASYLCNQLGLDTISTGATIACAMELQEKGILNTEIRFGEASKLKEIVKRIAYGKDLGKELALGSKRFASQYGVEEYSLQVKGLELPAYDPRGAQGQGLAYATTNRGGCHLRGGYMIGPEILGAPKMLDRFAYTGKGGHAVRLQDFGAAIDSLVVCRFATFALSAGYWARLLSAVTGEEIDAEGLMRIGERIYNLERLYNLREGFGRKDDTLPRRLLEERVADGPSKGEVVHLEEMLEEYYEFRGWDREGVPKLNKLRELGLKE